MTQRPHESADLIRAVVVKLNDPDRQESAWIACSMNASTWGILAEDEWQEWRAKALDLCLADWREYEVREVTLRLPQGDLDALFALHTIDGQVDGASR